MIEFDLLMIKIFEVYAIQKEEMKNHLKYLFYAADVNFFIFQTSFQITKKVKSRSIYRTL